MKLTGEQVFVCPLEGFMSCLHLSAASSHPLALDSLIFAFHLIDVSTAEWNSSSRVLGDLVSVIWALGTCGACTYMEAEHTYM